MIRRKILNGIFTIINLFTPKIKRSIFVRVGSSAKNNCEDLINFSGNNVLSFLHAFINKPHTKKITIFVDYFDESRLPLYNKIVFEAKQNNVILKFVKSYTDKSGIERIVLCFLEYTKIYRSKIWIVGTGDSALRGKLHKQYFFNMNYFISCKNDLIVGNNDRWSYLDFCLTTSLMGSTVISAQTGVNLDRCVELGFPRNDSLFCQTNKIKVLNWIESEIGFRPKKIIVYAPTYRDYERNMDNSYSRFLFGFDVKNLEHWILENKVCIVAKLHQLTSKSIVNLPKGVIPFRISFSFSFYDLLSITDCLITDYSSVGYDYLLLDRPIIYNLYDLEKYKKNRGLSYDPYEDFCPGEIVENSVDLMNELNNVINNIDSCKEKRERLLRIFHKHIDDMSSRRVVDFFCDEFDLG